MAHAQEPDFVFRRNGRAHLNGRGRHFSRLLAAKVCASAVLMLDTPCSELVWRVLATHSIRQFPLHFPSRASSCAITFQLDSTWDGKSCHEFRNHEHQVHIYRQSTWFNLTCRRSVTRSERGKEHSTTKVNWIGHNLHRNYLLKIEQKIEETRIRGRRRKQIGIS